MDSCVTTARVRTALGDAECSHHPQVPTEQAHDFAQLLAAGINRIGDAAYSQAVQSMKMAQQMGVAAQHPNPQVEAQLRQNQLERYFLHNVAAKATEAAVAAALRGSGLDKTLADAGLKPVAGALTRFAAGAVASFAHAPGTPGPAKVFSMEVKNPVNKAAPASVDVLVDRHTGTYMLNFQLNW